MKNYELWKKNIATLTIIAILLTSLSPLFSKKAEAQWITWDPGNFVPNLADNIKDYGLDALAWTIVNHVIERMSASTVKWINGGFKGKPAYLENPEKFYADIGKKEAGQYIFDNPNLNFLCGPIQAKVRIALAKNFIQDNRQWQCTLDDVKGNLDDFLDDFENGSWDKFFELSQREQNNPIGAFMKAENELRLQISAKQSLKDKELSWGNGFLSFKTCERWNISEADRASAEADIQREIDANSFGDQYLDSGNVDDDGNPIDESADSGDDGNVDADGNPVNYNPENFAGESEADFFVRIEGERKAQEPSCAKEKVNTPGGVISEQLNKTLGLGGDKLAVADEINEIVSALLNQLTGKIIGGIGKGLRGLSKPDSSNENKIFNEQLSSSKPGGALVGYFCFDQDTDPNAPRYDTNPDTCAYPDTPNTEILEQPPFDPSQSPTGGTLASPDNVGNFIPGAVSGGTPGGDTTILPNDPDCTNYTYGELASMANEVRDEFGNNVPFDDAMRNLDCEPR